MQVESARECLLQQAQFLVALHFAELLFNLQGDGGAPPQLLIAGAPPRDATRLGVDPRHHALDQIGGLEAGPEFRRDAQSMERQRLLSPFVETDGGRRVDPREVADEALQRALGIGVGRMRVGGVQCPPPLDLLRFGEVAHDVFPRVPLAALHRHVTEGLAHRRAEALGAIKDDQQCVRRTKAALLELAQERRTDPCVFRRRLHHAQDAFFPVRRTPSAITSWSDANVFPSSNNTSQSASSWRRSCNCCSDRALAAMKRRDTVDYANPNASGTASAAASYSRHEIPPSTRRKSPVSRARGVCSVAYVANGISTPAC